MPEFKAIEICAGAGGQAIGLEAAGFKHVALVEIDPNACNTLRANKPDWNVIEEDVNTFSAEGFNNIDLFAGGVPCPPFSVAGKQLGEADERDLFPEAIRLIKEINPKAVMLENVKGLLSKRFDGYRKSIEKELVAQGYWCEWRLLYSSDFGVPQLRPRAILVGLKEEFAPFFLWPKRKKETTTVKDALYNELASLNWKQVDIWAESANNIAPTLVGGSKKHGGADLGPTRAKKAWAQLGIDGKGIANEPPSEDFEGMPRLTIKMAALIQGFPEHWVFTGKKTPAYRQIGNAFPPPVAEAIGLSIKKALNKSSKKWEKGKVQEINFASIS